ncbi:MAG TPA: XRE family transcriptional regulator [Thermomicrobiales bacterium]|nr:XRE family transcriptional regulator [Thermomicrobiales bacterium]
MTNFEVDVAPDVLLWARKSIGLTPDEAARKIGIDALTLRYWEEGAENPTIGKLRKMAEVYKRPLAVLLLPEPPRSFDALKDFRLLQRNQGKPYSPALHLAFRRVQMQREVAEELAELEGAVPPPIDLPISPGDDPEASGDTIRAWLGTSVRDAGQGSRGDDLSRWIDLVEDKSILVAQVGGIAIEEMRGCSISDQPFPAIVINGKDAPRGKLFTLLHELVHVLLHAGGVCDLEDRRRHVNTPTERIERYCNQVAAAILMPRELVLRDPAVEKASEATRWSQQELRRVADLHGVSTEAMLLRLVTLNKASWDFYINRRPHFLQAYEEARRAQGERGGGPSFYRMKLRDFGRRYTSAVVDAYHRRDINSAELADYLEIKVNQLQRLEEELGARR